MKSKEQKLTQINRMIMSILSSGNNSILMTARWTRLIKLRSELA